MKDHIVFGTLSEEEIADRAAKGTLHELFGLPKSVFESDDEISVYVPIKAQKPITSEDLMAVARHSAGVER